MKLSWLKHAGLAVIAVFSLLFTPFVGAAPAGELPVETGIIDATHPLYNLEVQIEDAALSAGFIDIEALMVERAAEAQKAFEKGEDEAGERALNSLNRVSKSASSDDTTGLAKAISVLEDARIETPDNADVGLNEAISMLQVAMDRAPVDVNATSPVA